MLWQIGLIYPIFGWEMGWCVDHLLTHLGIPNKSFYILVIFIIMLYYNNANKNSNNTVFPPNKQEKKKQKKGHSLTVIPSSLACSLSIPFISYSIHCKGKSYCRTCFHHDIAVSQIQYLLLWRNECHRRSTNTCSGEYSVI